MGSHVRCISLLTLYQPLPCVEKAAFTADICVVKNQKNYHLTNTEGNTNFTDLWFCMAERAKELNGTFVEQYISLLSDEESTEKLEGYWKAIRGKYVLIALIKIRTDIDKKLVEDELNKLSGDIKWFYTLDNADKILFFSTDEEEEIENFYSDLSNIVIDDKNTKKKENIYYSLYALSGRIANVDGEIKLEDGVKSMDSSILLKKMDKEGGWCEGKRKELSIKLQDSMEGRDKKWLSYYQSINQILNLLEQYEQKEKFKDLFYIYFPALKLFLNQLGQAQEMLRAIEAQNSCYEIIREKYEKTQKIEEAVSQFIDSMELLIHHIGISCVSILNLDGRNGLAYDVPLRLCLLYLSAMYEICQILNDEDYEYQFFLSPLAYSRPKTNIYDFGLEPESRLLRILIAKHQLYCPRALLALLGHECSHYIGQKTRERELRMRKYIQIAVLALVEIMLPEEDFAESVSRKEFTDQEAELLECDWSERKQRLYKFFIEKTHREIVVKNKGREHPYHFTELEQEVYDTAINLIFVDPTEAVVSQINMITEELREYLNFCASPRAIMDVLEKEIRKAEENLKNSILSGRFLGTLREVRSNLKEIVADCGSVLLFQLDPKSYLEEYQLSEGHIPDTDSINNIIINRVAVLHMVLAERDGNWKRDWEKLNAQNASPFLTELKRQVDAYVKEYEHLTEKRTAGKESFLFSEKDKGLQGQIDIFMLRLVIQSEREYLGKVYENLKAQINGTKVSYNRIRLRNVYECFKVYPLNEEEVTYQEFFQYLDEMIGDYKQAVQRDWEKTKGK